MHQQLGTFADYYKLGVETGTLEARSAIQWAGQVVAQSVQPLGDMAEVALSPDDRQLLCALLDVSGIRDRARAARWLFRKLLQQLHEGRRPDEAIQAAKHLALSSGMDVSLHEVLCSIADSIGVSELGHYGTVEEALIDLTHFLQAQGEDSLPSALG